MGAAVFDRKGRSAWALSLTGIETRFREDRREFLGNCLLREAHRLTGALQPGDGVEGPWKARKPGGTTRIFPS